jgi:hypothetical protein
MSVTLATESLLPTWGDRLLLIGMLAVAYGALLLLFRR